jgi:putative DNA primase/helicase
MDFTEDLISYQKNAWPAMVAHLAKDLGVSSDALYSIGIGWIPLDECWVFPERDAEGRVIGLVRRYPNGKKYDIKGGKRGLTYAISQDYNPDSEKYIPGSHNWTRCSEDYPCPICGRTHWCMVSSECPSDPQAVLCGRTPEGAVRPMGDAGYLHIRKSSGRVSKVGGGILASSTLPVLVVEGQSDTAAAHDLGFGGVGKPSATGGMSFLADLLVGRDVVVIGENDAGTGRLGMEKTYETLKSKCKSVVKLLPPDGIKDLRAWVRSGLDRTGLEEAIKMAGVTTSASDLLESAAPLDIADRWLRERHYLAGLPILRQYAGNYYRFDGAKYNRVDGQTFLRGDLYAFLKGKTVKKFNSKGEVTITPFEANSHEVSDIIDALTMTCPIYKDAPCWLDDDEHAQPQDMVVFKNGWLTLPDLTPEPVTPKFFSMTAMPYEYHAAATCPTWTKLLQEVFPNDPEKIALLQEWFGYNLVADTSQEKLMFFIGRPGAGKGTVLEALRAMLGSPQVASTSFDTLVGDFGLQPLLGKLAAILPDAHITKRGDPSKALQVLKEISGRDGVGINRKNKEFLSDHKLSCRFTISVNSMPDLPDHERSLDRRLLLLHFGESFYGREDTRLKDRIVKEAPGIAVWALQGLLRLRRGGFTAPASSQSVIEEFRKQSSPVSEFADEYCEFGSEAQVPVSTIYDAYARWCKDQGIFAGTITKFSQRFCMAHPGIIADRLIFQGKQARCFQGVKLTQDAVDRYLVGRR